MTEPSNIDRATDYAIEQMRAGLKVTEAALMAEFGVTLWGAESAIRIADDRTCAPIPKAPKPAGQPIARRTYTVKDMSEMKKRLDAESVASFAASLPRVTSVAEARRWER